MTLIRPARAIVGWLTAACVVLFAAGPSAQSVPGAPGQPAASVSGSQVTLTWTAPATGAPVTGYLVVARQVSGGPIIASLPLGNVLTLTATAGDGTYFVTVRATNSLGTGPESTGVGITVRQGASVPGPPANFAATVTGTTASFTWTTPTSGGTPTGYSIVASMTPSGPIIATLPVGNLLTYSVPGVPTGTYYVRVIATNAVGAGAESNVVAVVVGGQPTLSGPSNVTVTNANTQVVGSTTLSSSTRLKVAWTAPTGYVIDHYAIRAVEAGAATDVTAAASQTSATLTALKASTTYAVTVKSCQDAACVQYGEPSSVSGTTSAEYWQVQGTGSSASTSTVVVANSNVLAWPVLYGAEAGSSLQGKVRLYYRPKLDSLGYNVVMALSGTATAAAASVSSFTQDTNYGLKNPSPAATFIKDVLATQGVPRFVGGRLSIRLFFEATGADGKTRNFYLDSQDGLAGQDFHPGSPTAVTETADWEVGGAAAPTVVIGVKGDASRGDTGLLQARQSKIGVPLLTNWLWDEAPGTFMVITGQDECGKTTNGLFYAQWDGTRWNVSKDSSNCARPLAQFAHGPVLLHRGAARYKLYYEDSLTDTNHNDKPLRMIYGDGALTGASSLEFDDWEVAANAREVHFFWPNGSLVGVSDESGFGDHAIFYPTGDPDVQLMYLNLNGVDGPSGFTGPRGTGIAVLVNP